MKKKNQRMSLKVQFKEAVKYVKECKNAIYSSIIIFFVSALLGFMFEEKFRFFNEIIQKMVADSGNLNTIEMIFFIMQNNFQAALLIILGGLLFGIYPIISAILNGAIIGYVATIVSQIAGFSELLLLVPHGIFELPAIFISFGLGIRLGFSMFLPAKKRIPELKRRFYNSANAYLMIVAPLLIIAAIIEGILIFLIA